MYESHHCKKRNVGSTKKNLVDVGCLKILNLFNLKISVNIMSLHEIHKLANIFLNQLKIGRQSAILTVHNPFTLTPLEGNVRGKV